MAGALVIPGIQVRTEFAPPPALPGPTGILGVVGVVDRGPIQPTPVGSFSEFIEKFGKASQHTMPEVRTAFANGVSQTVIARTAPGRGRKAFVDLLDNEGETVVRLEARAEGEWGNQLAARVTQVRTLSGQGVKHVNIEILFDGQVIESFDSLVMDPLSPNYLFDQINNRSSTVIAIDPLFEKGLPNPLARTAFTEIEARAAQATLQAGAADVVRAEAKRSGRSGNRISVRVVDGQATLPILGAGDAPSVDIRAREAGTAGTDIRVAIATDPGGVIITIVPAAGAPRNHGPAATTANIVSLLDSDTDVEAISRGDVLPNVLSSTQLLRTVTIEVHSEGRDPVTYANLPDLAAIAAIDDPLVQFEAVTGATALPDANLGIPFQGGRNRGAAMLLAGEASDEPLLELAPVSGAPENLEVGIASAVSTIDNATGVVNLTVFESSEIIESFQNLTMDPDDPNYLPFVLETSAYLRALDLFVRSQTTSIPRGLVRPVPLAQGTSPLPVDYQAALERLELAEEVDLVIASVNGQLDDSGVRSVHQNVVAHCEKMDGLARNRIGLGSVTQSETDSVATILDHANDVRSNHFILVTPADGEAAIAGLLGRMDYFRSPTFKTVASLGTDPGNYSDAELTLLVSGNVLTVNKRKNRGIIVIKGILTSGRQVNVQRTVNKAVRDIKAIADNYVGLLNNEGTRNALKQQAFALLAQMERDGALVPSTDGTDPAFKVNVYSTQADFAQGIVRVDIALRPVRAIDYIYVTIFVQN